MFCLSMCVAMLIAVLCKCLCALLVTVKSCVMVCHQVLSLCVSCDHGVLIDLKVDFYVEYCFVIAHLLGLDYQMGAFES